MDINHSMVTTAAIDAQDSKRELSRLEATIIGQYLLIHEVNPMFWHDFYYRPRSCAGVVSATIAQNYMDARWDEKVALDMLGTYCINTPDMGTLATT